MIDEAEVVRDLNAELRKVDPRIMPFGGPEDVRVFARHLQKELEKK